MVLTTPEAIIEQASTQKLLDVLIDESVRTTARRPIMMQFDPSSGWIWRRWKGTVFSETWISCVRNIIYALFILYLYRAFPRIRGPLTGFGTLWGQLLSVTTLTITFFVNQSYALWRKCYELSRRLQGRLHDIDMTLAIHAARKTPASPSEPSSYTTASRQLLDLVSRYVRLFNLLTYASFTRSHRPMLTPRGMRRLVERGLMTPGELQVLIDAEIPATQRHNAVLMWITRIFVEGRQAGHFMGGSGFEQQFMEKIHVIRSQYGAIGDELQGRMPLAYAHIVQVLVDCVLMMYPLMAFSSGMSPLLGVLGTGLLTTSYQGLFDLAKQFLDPYDNENYGRGEDPLCVDTLIAETNAGSLRWMYGFEQMPVSSQRIKDGELFDYILPVRGYSVEELEKMEEERLQKEKELKELREREEAERVEAERLKAEEVEKEDQDEEEEEEQDDVQALEEVDEVPADTSIVDESIIHHDEFEELEVEELAVETNRTVGASDESTESLTGVESPTTTQVASAKNENSTQAVEESVTADAVAEEVETLHKVTLLKSGLPVSLSSTDVNGTDSQVANIDEELVVEEEPATGEVEAVKATTEYIAKIEMAESFESNVTKKVEMKQEEQNEMEVTGNELKVNGNSPDEEEPASPQINSTIHDNAEGDEEKEHDIEVSIIESDTELYVDEFEDFESFKDLPWFDEVGPDGQEVRLSQMLADEEWEEEKAYELEKASLSSPLTLEDFQKERDELVEAAENELLETELVMMASPGAEAEGRAVGSSDRSSSRPTYDQTKLSGVAQLWGLPPDEDLPRPAQTSSDAYEEEKSTFGNIGQLWGRRPEPSSSSEEASYFNVESSFEYIDQLWDDTDNGLESKESTYTPTEPVESADSDYFERGDDDDEELDLSGYEGFEWHEESSGDRLSQMLADEVWDFEEEEEPDEQIRTLEDYTKKVVEILEAAEDEILETEAILRAPPAAESVTLVEREGDEEPLLQAVNETRPTELSEETDSDVDNNKDKAIDNISLDALEMDVLPGNSTSDFTDTTASEGRVPGIARDHLKSMNEISAEDITDNENKNENDEEEENDGNDTYFGEG